MNDLFICESISQSEFSSVFTRGLAQEHHRLFKNPQIGEFSMDQIYDLIKAYSGI